MLHGACPYRLCVTVLVDVLNFLKHSDNVYSAFGHFECIIVLEADLYIFVIGIRIHGKRFKLIAQSGRCRNGDFFAR